MQYFGCFMEIQKKILVWSANYNLFLAHHKEKNMKCCTIIKVLNDNDYRLYFQKCDVG